MASLNSTSPEIPGPTGRTFEGPWLQQQILFSLTLGILSVLAFGVWKRRYPSIYQARHPQQSPTMPYQRLRKSIFGWIMPTLVYPDRSVLLNVGIDAAVALLFFKMIFRYLAMISIWTVVVLIPVHYYTNGWIDGVSPGEEVHPQHAALAPHPVRAVHLTRDILYENTQLVSTYLYTLLALHVLWRTYAVYIGFVQGHASVQLRSEAERTVKVSHLPRHLMTSSSLATYFDELHMPIAHATVVQDTTRLDALLAQRLEVLQRLERAWAGWLGDPAEAKNYNRAMLLQQTSRVDQPAVPGGAPRVGTHIVAKRKRPTFAHTRNPFGARVDAIDQLSYQFNQLDRAVHALRRDTFTAMHTAFVTFRTAAHAEIASQVVHYPRPGTCITQPACEPRDIIWVNLEPNFWGKRVRKVTLTLMMGVLLTATLSIGALLAALVNMRSIRAVLPWLANMMDQDVRLRAFVQKSLPTLLLILINALVPIAMEYSTYHERISSRSNIDHRVMSRYYLYLLFSVVFVFAFTNAWETLKGLAESPMRMMDKLAQSLPVARQFSLSYVIFQGLTIQPFQLVELPTIAMRFLHKLFYASTPRGRIHGGYARGMPVATLYPQALLIFTLSILYSIVSPLIVLFGALYFGVAYIVLKYELLNVMEKPYDSHGSAWPLAIHRCVWALLLFQIFQLSLFSVRKQVVTSLLVLPLLGITAWYLVALHRNYAPLTSHLNLYDIYMAEEHESVTEQQSDVTSTRAGPRTPPTHDPPLSWSHPGLLHVDDEQYKQPSLTSRLPSLWLPESLDALA
ncbi:hypothetical protein MVES1_003242 [Malassezia vespertilionis]|uniref:DUF221-domain-containing protein n=1 Tax=Malassezia vespertilionis TaxID=2020962 RepID=A0A2N1J9M9_9BASI|nr:uncharacterized protein MVES1_003242 [Malassezia vespertilionis]PKI83182.1 hypothetical protein MVES_003081 [Malassezia vespertilionis]WFD07874.1 hypothetical protein MVES1_003242 [Malassezia vespertilionis]